MRAIIRDVYLHEGVSITKAFTSSLTYGLMCYRSVAFLRVFLVRWWDVLQSQPCKCFLTVLCLQFGQIFLSEEPQEKWSVLENIVKWWYA